MRGASCSRSRPGRRRCSAHAAPVWPAPRGRCSSATPAIIACLSGGARRTSDDAPADLLIGQPDFYREGRNAQGGDRRRDAQRADRRRAADGVLAVADAWNHRVLIWRGYPETSNRPADVVLGQADFHSGLANRGGGAAARRYAQLVLWRHFGRRPSNCRRHRKSPCARLERNSVSATARPQISCSGSATSRHATRTPGKPPDALGMRWPHAIAVVGNTLFVADAGDNRVMVWRGWPRRERRAVRLRARPARLLWTAIITAAPITRPPPQ